MQSARLHASLHAFAADATATLAAAVAAGDEVPFEVIEAGAGGARPGLFHYQPLTAEFIEAHWETLSRLPVAAEAQAALAALAGLSGYLDTYAAQHRADVPPAADALRCFAHRVLDRCAGEFELRPDHFEPAYRELIDATHGAEGDHVVLALLQGLDCESGEVELAEGTLLVRLARLEVLPPDPYWRNADGPATVLALLPPLGEGGLAGAVGRLCDVQTAMHLYAPGITLAPLAWIRGQRAAWRALPVPGAGRGGRPTLITAGGEEELRAFTALVARHRPAEGELAWALDRFELGCRRDDPLVGLTDHLLALRALLEPEGPRSGRLAGRVAALCATPDARLAVTERVAHAIMLERAFIGGMATGTDAPARCGEIEHHLRALLRDVICGHLHAELVELADSLLWEQGEPEPSGEVARASRPAAGTGGSVRQPGAPRAGRLLGHGGRRLGRRGDAIAEVAGDPAQPGEVVQLHRQFGDDERLERRER